MERIQIRSCLKDNILILDRPNCFGRVQIKVGTYLSPNHFGQVQIRLFWTNFYNLDLSKMVGTRPKLFGPIEGQVTNGCIRDPFIIGNF